MPQELGRGEILENLRLLSEWLRVKYPAERFELTVIGGAAMALDGFKDQTQDIDLLKPERLPGPLTGGIAHISRVKRLSPEWINNNVANILRNVKPLRKLPRYFSDISHSIDIGENLKVNLIGRQALITLKLWAATPSHTKHSIDIKSLNPSKEEIREAVRFVLSIDNNQLRRDDLRMVLRFIGFDLDEFIRTDKE
jgi:hypothetical protein